MGPLACNAPWTTLHFNPRGRVEACCANKHYLLGDVSESTLEEIWASPEALRLRSAIAAGDFSMGCHECGKHVEAGHPGRAWARVYDHETPVEGRAGRPQRLELELTNTCNLQCIQCTGELSSAIRAQREQLPPLPKAYGDSFFEQLPAFLADATVITFLGGEPFLGREPLRVFDLLIEGGWSPRCHVTTNGTVWNDRVERILERLSVDVSVSVDAASPGTYAGIRVGGAFETVMENIERFKATADRRGTNVSLNYCLMRPNAGELLPFLAMADRHDMDVYVNSVFYPPRLSLYSLAVDELAGTLAQMHDQERRWRPPLGRNRMVWETQINELEAQLGQLRAATAMTAAVPVAPGSPYEQARRLATDFAGEGNVHIAVLDEAERVSELLPSATDVFGVDLSALIGRPMREGQALLVDRFGPVIGVTSSFPAPGVDQHDMTFAGEPSVVVRSLRTSRADGAEVCILAAQVQPVTDMLVVAG